VPHVEISLPPKPLAFSALSLNHLALFINPMSRSTRHRLRLALEIQRSGHIVTIPCDRCAKSGKVCVVMTRSNYSRLKCSECVRQNKPCVNISWDSLDRTREDYQRKVDEDEVELAKITARLVKNKRILRQAEERAKKNAECLMEMLEMNATGEPDASEDDLTADLPHITPPTTSSSFVCMNVAMNATADLSCLLGDSDATFR
jgi:hypothetical protein